MRSRPLLELLLVLFDSCATVWTERRFRASGTTQRRKTMLILYRDPDLSCLFEENSGWIFAPIETCKRRKLFPNMLAHCETSAALALIVERSTTGKDFALSETGLNYLITALDKGALKDGKAVLHAFVVLADFDPQVKSQKHLFKIVSHSTAQAIRDRFVGVPSNLGFNGSYWWLSPEIISEVEDEWSIDFQPA
jgi:hypothetical protein